jgi:hypothetical protein
METDRTQPWLAARAGVAGRAAQAGSGGGAGGGGVDFWTSYYSITRFWVSRG